MLHKGRKKVKNGGHIACDLRWIQPQGTESLNKPQRKEACYGCHCGELSFYPSSGTRDLLSQTGQRTSSPVMRKPLNAVQTISLHVGCIRAQSPRPSLAIAPEQSLETVLGKNCLTLTWGFIQQQWHVSSGARHVLYLVVIFFYGAWFLYLPRSIYDV